MLTPSGQLPLRYFKSSSQWSWVMKGGVTSPLKLTQKKNCFFFSSESSAALSFLNETSPWQEVKSRVSLHQRTKVITVCVRVGECLWQSPTLSQNASGYSLDISAYTPPVISLKKKKKGITQIGKARGEEARWEVAADPSLSQTLDSPSNRIYLENDGMFSLHWPFN